VSKTRFIAETDISGDVVWVWRSGEGDRTARPVGDPGRCLVELDRAEFHGAPGEAISDWLLRQLGGPPWAGT